MKVTCCRVTTCDPSHPVGATLRNSRPLPAEVDVMYLWEGTTWAGKAIPEVEPCSLSRYIKDHMEPHRTQQSLPLPAVMFFSKARVQSLAPICTTYSHPDCWILKMQRQRLKSLPADTCTIRKKAIRIRCFLNTKLCYATIISCSFKDAVLSRAYSVCFEVAVDLGINTSTLLLSRGFSPPQRWDFLATKGVC